MSLARCFRTFLSSAAFGDARRAPLGEPPFALSLNLSTPLARVQARIRLAFNNYRATGFEHPVPGRNA